MTTPFDWILDNPEQFTLSIALLTSYKNNLFITMNHFLMQQDKLLLQQKIEWYNKPTAPKGIDPRADFQMLANIAAYINNDTIPLNDDEICLKADQLAKELKIKLGD